MLKILIAEDDFASRKFLSTFLSQYGECDVVVDGLEAIDAYMISMREKRPYDLICLDIMMPKIDGVKVLKAIRDIEAKKYILPEKRVKIIITTALSEAELVHEAFEYGCEAYASKPIKTDKFIEVMHKIGLLFEDLTK
ncbi:MAG: histidine kinase [Herbinix sp.]|jgi:two-component system chemotaxis response regulator CheY|nr:histidine kinase [Herbinix sp.]